MTYTVSAGDTILADHLNTSNTEHINSNIPENIDDYTANETEMQSQTDPYPASVVSLATSLSEELLRYRYQLDAIIGKTYWYEDAPIYYTDYTDFDAGTSSLTTGGKIVFDVAGTGTDTVGSINFGTASAALYWDGTDLVGTSSADIKYSAHGTDHIFLSGVTGTTIATIDDTGIDIVTNNFTTGGQFVIDVDGTAIGAAGAITLGAGGSSDSGLYFNGTDLIGTSTGDIELNAGAGLDIRLLADVGIGTSTINTQCDIFDTTGTQLRLAYDNLNLADVKVNSTGTMTLTLSGTSKAFDFEDQIVRKPVFEDYSEKLVTINNADGTTDLDMELANNFWINMDEDITITVSNAPASGKISPLTIWLRQDNLGTATVSWTNFVWASGTAPTIATGVGTQTVVCAIGTDTNTRMYGFVGGSDMR